MGYHAEQCHTTNGRKHNNHHWMRIESSKTPQRLHHPNALQISLTTIQQRDLADTGASVSATGMKEILHHQFTTHTARYEITGYDGNTTKAAGQGYAHVRNDTTNGIDKILFVYSPSISGCWHDIFVGTQCTHESWHTSMDTEGNTLNEFGMDNVLQWEWRRGLQISESSIKRRVFYPRSSVHPDPSPSTAATGFTQPATSNWANHHLEYDSTGATGTNGLHTRRLVWRFWRIHPSPTKTIHQHNRPSSMSRHLQRKWCRCRSTRMQSWSTRQRQLWVCIWSQVWTESWFRGSGQSGGHGLDNH